MKFGLDLPPQQRVYAGFLRKRMCLASCPRPLIVLELELELVLDSVILGLKPVCYRVMPAALLQYRN
jgi:hypothetical protein